MRSPWFLTTPLCMFFTYSSANETLTKSVVVILTTALVIPDVEHHHNAPRQTSSQGSPLGWVALGDSYVSGTGAGDSFQGDTMCERRIGAYPLQLEGGTTFDFASCPGAFSSTIVEDGQFGGIGTNESVNLVTIGQNDVSYTPALSACLLFNSGCSDALSTFNNSLFVDMTVFQSFNNFVNTTLKACNGTHKIPCCSRPHTLSSSNPTALHAIVNPFWYRV